MPSQDSSIIKWLEGPRLGYAQERRLASLGQASALQNEIDYRLACLCIFGPFAKGTVATQKYVFDLLPTSIEGYMGILLVILVLLLEELVLNVLPLALDMVLAMPRVVRDGPELTPLLMLFQRLSDAVSNDLLRRL